MMATDKIRARVKSLKEDWENPFKESSYVTVP